MATMNVSLPDGMKEWVESQATGSEYGNVSDYVRDLIRRDRRRKEAIATLQAAVTDGINSGEAEPFDIEGFLLRMHKRHVVK